MSLTAKQESFARLVALGKTQADAYRESYDAERMKDEAIHVNASKLASDAKVSLRIEQLKEEQQVHLKKKHNIEVDDLVNMILQAAAIAKKKDDANNLRGAAMDIAKLTGQIVDKSQQVGDIKITEARRSVVDRLLERKGK